MLPPYLFRRLQVRPENQVAQAIHKQRGGLGGWVKRVVSEAKERTMPSTSQVSPTNAQSVNDITAVSFNGNLRHTIRLFERQIESSTALKNSRIMVGDSTLYPDYVRVHAPTPDSNEGLEVEGVIHPPLPGGYNRFGLFMGDTSADLPKKAQPTLWISTPDGREESVVIGSRPYHLARRIHRATDFNKFLNMGRQN